MMLTLDELEEMRRYIIRQRGHMDYTAMRLEQRLDEEMVRLRPQYREWLALARQDIERDSMRPSAVAEYFMEWAGLSRGEAYALVVDATRKMTSK